MLFITVFICFTIFICYSPSDTSVPANVTDPIRNNDVIELVHVRTDKLLNSHDVAAPLSPANQEIAGYVNYSAKFIPYLHWRIVCLMKHIVLLFSFIIFFRSYKVSRIIFLYFGLLERQSSD